MVYIEQNVEMSDDDNELTKMIETRVFNEAMSFIENESE